MSIDISALDPDGDLKRISKPDLVREAQKAIVRERLDGDKIKTLIRDGTKDDWYLKEKNEDLAKAVDRWRSQAIKAASSLENLASTTEYHMARIVTLESELHGERRSNEMEIGRLNGIIEGLKGRAL